MPRPTYTPAPLPTRRPVTMVQPTLARQTTPTPQPTRLPAASSNSAWLRAERPALAEAIADLPWVADGIIGDEQRAAQELIDLAVWYEGVFTALVTRPWISDGVSRDEFMTLQNLRWMARNSEVAAEQIVSQPFLETIASPDALAVMSLRLLARFYADDFQRIMSHPNLVDGISDEEAKVVALLYGTNAKRPETVPTLLSPERIHVEERAITLPLSGETLLSIIRIRDQRTDRMDLLEHSVRALEEFIAEPLPTNYIALLFDDATTYELGGNNFGTHMSMSLLFDIEGGPLEKYAGSTIAHEVAHYYFGGANRDWLNEGAAELLASVSENARADEEVEASNYPCASADTLAELESLDAEVKTNEFRCNYSLGEALFLDLYQTLSESTFRQGIRNLYLKSRVDDGSDVCLGIRLNVCHLKSAFQDDVTEQTAAAVENIVTRHYYGTAGRAVSPPDTAPVVPDLPDIGGYLDEAYLALDKDHRHTTAASVFSARDAPGDAYLFIEGFRSKSQYAQDIHLEYVGYLEDGSRFFAKEAANIVKPSWSSFFYWIRIPPPEPSHWPPGRYWVYVYSERQKIAQVEFEVVP